GPRAPGPEASWDGSGCGLGYLVFSTVIDARGGHRRKMKEAWPAYPAGQAVECPEVGSVWCTEPAQQLDPGYSLAPAIVAPYWEARRPDSFIAEYPLARHVRGGQDDGATLSTVSRARW